MSVFIPKINQYQSFMKQPMKTTAVNKAVQTCENNNSTTLPLGFNSLCNISFSSQFKNRRLVENIELEQYWKMSDEKKEKYRNFYNDFLSNKNLDKAELFDKTFPCLPLRSDKTMEDFIKISQKYLKYKDQPIICLGRSPKWFLNTAYWMKDGLKDYKFVAFSNYWFYPDNKEGIKKLQNQAPTNEEEMAYRKYLDRIGANPQTIVETMQKEGKKTVITDYICSGKGACSFLDILSRYADELGILEEFSKSIQIVGIGSIEYMEMLNPHAESIPYPRVPMPPLLKPYEDNIKQEFYNMNYILFDEMLLNRNVNECRSTYYPHNAWTVYRPDVFKTGMIDDMGTVRKVLSVLDDEKHITSFTPVMKDYRNIINFRILDYLDSKNMLREKEV